ncbi:hypothetical protein ACMU_17290 [Actibacterium mucosum KCTC 23349]|uniref:Uncharacterized protein n=1 Tax=Actibacterium mucosum KCTC 23349 TaxID=1454373 RepID=A0A037ZFU0_9RHOB|nr:class I SAM-dependent methyltransferase [Actibacterium mucosum]KAJ54463.1 hypothetical protein ACMU_17290 [Actibacterium mucosum KCTC 23349]
MGPDDILTTYELHAAGYARSRSKVLFERGWLDRALAHAPGRRVLDLGCGSGNPIARYLSDRRAEVTGVDGAAAMVALFQQTLPGAEAIHADMRDLALNRQFDVVVAWNSFFHLAPDDQRAMFPVFAAHAAPGAVLLFTTGHQAGEAMGSVQGTAVYHSSLSPDDYRGLLKDAGFTVLKFTPQDPDCNQHSVWLARFTA